MVAAHKEYAFPNDGGYLPLHVGSAGKPSQLGIFSDDTGENISSLNPFFCELTGLYWLWKNVEAQYYGLVHYRRYFKPLGRTGDHTKVKDRKVASSEDLVHLLSTFDIVIPRQRNYYIETVQRHYINAHHKSDLQSLSKLLEERAPEYAKAWEILLNSRKLSLYNMFVMRREYFDSYCRWLFPILFELKEKIPYESYGPYQKRVFGFLSERLLNLWVQNNIAEGKICYLPVINLEGENKLMKAMGLLKRKFFLTRQE